ncbi:MAG TPA: hypothetical protein VLL05_17730 [Terriglobales bacterium]|nr:hypothetical protein [Terriglobales bacterium]
MKIHAQQFGLFLAAVLIATAAFAADKGQTFTGKVSDAMCGAHHMMSGSEADCTRACVGKGSKHALVVGDKVYTLESSDKAALASLDKAAGSTAKVTGTLNGDTIEVASVAAGK